MSNKTKFYPADGFSDMQTEYQVHVVKEEKRTKTPERKVGQEQR